MRCSRSLLPIIIVLLWAESRRGAALIFPISFALFPAFCYTLNGCCSPHPHYTHSLSRERAQLRGGKGRPLPNYGKEGRMRIRGRREGCADQRTRMPSIFLSLRPFCTSSLAMRARIRIWRGARALCARALCAREPSTRYTHQPS